MEGNWRLAFFRIWHVYVHLAYINTRVAAVADFGISNDRTVRRSHVGKYVYLFSIFFRTLEDTAGALKSCCGTGQYVAGGILASFFAPCNALPGSTQESFAEMGTVVQGE